ncbi:MAG: type II toxin-antitoxin system Phd/YefM family antitoxin [Bdellovibrionales bacterium]
MQEIGVFELKTHASKYISLLEQGEEFIITKRGKPVGELKSFENQRKKASIEELIKMSDDIRGRNQGSTIEEIVKDIRDMRDNRHA